MRVFKQWQSIILKDENMELRKYFKYYIRGVGVGLIIAWVTGALAYWKVGGSPTDIALIELELILSIIFLAISILAKDKTR